MLKRNLLLGAAVLMMAACAKEAIPGHDSVVEKEPVSEEESLYEPGIAVVKFSDSMIQAIESDLNAGKLATKSMGLNQALDELSITSMERLFPYAGEYEPRTRREGLHRWYVIHFDQNVPQTKASADLSAIPGVELVEGQHKIATLGFNDPRLSDQWNLINKAEGSSYRKGADINVSEVWEKFTVGRPGVIVGLVDGGADLAHPDLAKNCIPGNGEGSWNFVDNNDKIVAHQHGTHVAGIIAAINNNGMGVCGVAGGDAAAGKSGVKLLSCQIFQTNPNTGKDRGGNTASAVTWAADHGAVIINNSWGYTPDANGDGKISDSEKETYLKATISAADKAALDYFIKYAGCDNDGNQRADSPMKGGVAIFAAGNDAIANGIPANYEEVIAVGAIGPNGARASYSNYGDWVDICAPGGDSRYASVLSTIPSSKYGSLSGTSMACPHVTGVAALIVSYFGKEGFTNEDLKAKLLGGTSKKKGFISETYQIGNLVDALGSMFYNMGNKPSKVTSLAAKAESNTLNFTWKQTEDSEGFGAYCYRIIASKDKSAIEKADISAPGKDIKVVDVEVTSGTATGAELTAELKNLDFGTDYYIAIASGTYLGELSEKSDIISVKTGTNNPPVITLDKTSAVQKAHETVKYYMNIADPDGNPFEVTAETGSPAATLIAENAGGKFSIEVNGAKASAGTYKAVITAKDALGMSSTATFTYTILENHAPQQVKPYEDIFLTKVGESFSLNLDEYVSDEDGEDLNFTITSEHNDLLYFTKNGNNLKATALAVGTTSVTITATDGLGESVTGKFNVVVRAEGVEVEAYPNPVIDNLFVRTGKEKAKTSIKIYSQTGSEVYSAEGESSVFEPMSVNLAKLAPGRYKLSVSYNGKEHNKQIIKR